MAIEKRSRGVNMVVYSPVTITAVSSVATGVGILLTALRFWTRLFYARIALGPDDLFAAIASIFMTVWYALETYATFRGTSGNLTNDSTDAAIAEHKVEYAVEIVEKIAFGAVKLSLLFFFRRIFGVWDSFKRLNNFMLCVVAAWTIGYLGQSVFICGVHPEYLWEVDQHIPQAKCGSNGA